MSTSTGLDSLATRRQGNRRFKIKWNALDNLARVQATLKINTTAIGRRQRRKGKDIEDTQKRERKSTCFKQVQDGSSGQKVLLKWSEDSSFALLDYSDRLGRSHQVPGRSCEDFHTTATPLIPNTIRINIDSSPPRRVQPAQLTGT